MCLLVSRDDDLLPRMEWMVGVHAMKELLTEEESVRQIAADIARELREHPGRWFQGALVRFASGASTSTGYGLQRVDAVCWCLEGHICKRVDDEVRLVAMNKFHEAALIPEGSLNSWNDKPGRTVEDVIALCEKVAR